MADISQEIAAFESASRGEEVRDAMVSLAVKLNNETSGVGDMEKSVYDTNNNGKVDSAESADSVPWTGVTGKPDNATTSSAGLMSASDKTKLNGIAAGAEVNVQSDWNATSGDAAILHKPTTISGYGITDAYTKTEVDGIVTNMYRFAGSCAFASLPSLTAANVGKVYNITDNFTTTSDFVEGSGKDYPAGADVVIVESSSNTYKYDVMGGGGGSAEAGQVVQSDNDNPITFETDSAQIAKNTQITFEPIQDLHGYDHPWPAGGGANLLPTPANGSVSSGGLTLTINNGVYTITGTKTDGNAVSLLMDLPTTFVIPTIANSNAILHFNNASGSANVSFEMYNGSTRIDYWFMMSANSTYYISSYSGSSVTKVGVSVTGAANTAINFNFSPMIYDKNVYSSAPGFSPYANICPISGIDQLTITVNNDDSSPTETRTLSVDLPETVYGGTLNLESGLLTITKGFIENYKGGTLPGAWISDRDQYVSGGTPTVGAQVCYSLSASETLQLPPEQLELLDATNVVSVNASKIKITWRKGEVAVLEDTAEQLKTIERMMELLNGFHIVNGKLYQRYWKG